MGRAGQGADGVRPDEIPLWELVVKAGCLSSHCCEGVSWLGPLEVTTFDCVSGGGSWFLRRTNPEV